MGISHQKDTAIQNKIDDLIRATERLNLLQAHDAFVIIKKSLAIPKLLYLLRTSECVDNPLLKKFDNTLWSALTTILNVNLSDGDAGLGIRSALMPANPPFWHQLHLHSRSNNLSFHTAFQH